MKFQKFSQILSEIESLSSRIEMTDRLSKVLGELNSMEIDKAIYLILGRVVPEYVPIEFNFASKLMQKALAKTFNKSEDEVNVEYKKLGDLGLVAEKLSKRHTSSLSLLEVYQALYKIAISEGTGSQKDKIHRVVELISDCDSVSSRFVVRIIIGNLRLGLSSKTILDSLSVNIAGDKSIREKLDRSYGVRGDIGFVAKKLLLKGIEALDAIKIVPGIPILSMNCEREETIGKILERMGECILQPKYDGVRCQIHYSSDGFQKVKGKLNEQMYLDNKADLKVKIYSRNLEDLTYMFPEVSMCSRDLGMSSFVIDAEAVGYDKSGKNMVPFQETIQRKRKYNVEQMREEIPVKIFVFDILYADGEDLSSETLDQRVGLLRETVGCRKGVELFKMAPTDIVGKKIVFLEKLNEYINGGLEGVIAKDPKSKYMPGKRGFEWIKFKKSSEGHLIDDVDCVILGYYTGKGARAGFGIGALLVGVYNSSNNHFESIAKVGTGIKDNQWSKIKSKLDSISSIEKPKNVDVEKELFPDVWVKPEIVCVVDADEVTKSPNHRAGFKNGKGFSLRFPRLKKFNRKDKDPFNVTSVKEIERLFNLQ